MFSSNNSGSNSRLVVVGCCHRMYGARCRGTFLVGYTPRIIWHCFVIHSVLESHADLSATEIYFLNTVLTGYHILNWCPEGCNVNMERDCMTRDVLSISLHSSYQSGFFKSPIADEMSLSSPLAYLKYVDNFSLACITYPSSSQVQLLQRVIYFCLLSTPSEYRIHILVFFFLVVILRVIETFVFFCEKS